MTLFAIKKRIIFKAFINFLKENDAYVKYIENVQRQHSIPIFSTNALEKLMNCGSETGYGYYALSHAFSWRSTDEGDRFWRNLNETWRIMLSKINKDINE